jgi:hypothetical protein
MAKFRREDGSCTGRGFSMVDADGICAKFLSWCKRPNADGSDQAFTATAASDECACVGHGYLTGDSVKLLTTTTLPAPLALLTEYYIIWISADIFKLATSHYNAMAGTAIDITDTGTGTHSVYALGGGANWYLHADYTRNIAKDFATTDVNTTTETITIAGHGFSNCHRVVFSSTTTVPGGLTAGTVYFAIRVDDDNIKVATTYANAYAGTARDLTSQGTGTHSITPAEFFAIFCDTASPTVNDYNTGPSGGPPKFITVGYHTATAGYIYFGQMLWWDTATESPHGLVVRFTGDIGTYDSAEFAYDFRGGDEMMFIATRRGTTWNNVYLDEWDGISSLVEGTDKVGVLQSAAGGTGDVTLQLAAGQAANFTEGKYYYIYDFQGHSWVDYGRCLARDTGADTITLEGLGQNFPAGSVVCAYAHRTYMGAGALTAVWIPYISSTAMSRSFHNQSDLFYTGQENQYIYGVDTTMLGRMRPDDEGYYLAMRGIVTELYDKNASNVSGNRAYGKTKNMIQTYGSGLAQMLDYRTMDGIDYLHFNTNTTYTWMVRHSESAV